VDQFARNAPHPPTLKFTQAARPGYDQIDLIGFYIFDDLSRRITTTKDWGGGNAVTLKQLTGTLKKRVTCMFLLAL
jgi:hypothetical protein